jgi:hypothetical protein
MKAPDPGAYGIIVPLVNTDKEAAKAVAACRYSPVGMRSNGRCARAHYGAPFASGAVKRGFDMVMLTSDLSCMVAGARAQLDELKAKTA